MRYLKSNFVNRIILFYLSFGIVAFFPVKQLHASEPANTITGNVFADNDFEMYVNGRLVAEDDIDFTPHNVVTVEFEAEYPVLIAVKAIDFYIEGTGLEYNNTKAGDGGFILKLSDGSATNGTWKAKKVEWGPTNMDECLSDPESCKVFSEAIPKGWKDLTYDDSSWGNASVHTRAAVNPHARSYDNYNWTNAAFIWTEDLLVDNVILFRYRIEKPVD